MKHIRVYVKRVEVFPDDEGDVERPIDEIVFDSPTAEKAWDVAMSLKSVELITKK